MRSLSSRAILEEEEKKHNSAYNNHEKIKLASISKILEHHHQQTIICNFNLKIRIEFIYFFIISTCCYSVSKMKPDFKIRLIRFLFKLTLLLVNVNTYNANELNHNMDYLSMSSNEYVQSYRSVFQHLPFFKRDARGDTSSLAEFQAQKLYNFTTFYSDENSIFANNNNFTNENDQFENSYNLKIRLFSKIVLCKYFFGILTKFSI